VIFGTGADRPTPSARGDLRATRQHGALHGAAAARSPARRAPNRVPPAICEGRRDHAFLETLVFLRRDGVALASLYVDRLALSERMQ